MDMFNKTRSVLNSKMNDKMIQHSVFAGIVFLIIAHPLTFKTVDSILKVHDKNILLLIHSVVVFIIMYFGSIYIFEPLQKVLLEGVQNKSIWSNAKKGVENAQDVAKKRLPTEANYSGGTDHADAETDGQSVSKKEFGDRTREEVEAEHENFKDMPLSEAILCLKQNGMKGGELDNASLKDIRHLCA